MKGFKSTSTNPYTYTQDGVWKKGQYTFQAVVLSDSGYAFAFQRADTTWQTIDLSWQVKAGSYSKIQWTFTLEVDAVAFRLIANTVIGETTVLQPMLEKGSNGSTPIAHEEDLRGMDGDNHEFIFTRNTTGIAPDTPLSTQEDDYEPEDWTDNAQGVTPEIPFEFVSMREKKNGVWLDFSPPSLWAKWGEDGLSVNLLVEGHYNSHWEGVTKVVEIVGGVDVGGNEVVKVSAVFRKGEENIAATVSQSRGFQWYVNGVHLTAFDNQPFITLDETYGDGFADYVVLSYLVNSIREEERREIINISEGMDGIGEEFIFKANNSDTEPPVLPQTTDAGYQDDDYHGDWSDDPVAPTEANQFVWAAKRKKIGGIWEAFGDPSIWTKWVEDGSDAESLILSASSLTMACDSTNAAKTGQTITINAKRQNVTGAVSFDATPYKDNGVASTKITLGGSGDTRTLTDAQWLSTFQKVVITANLSGLSDTVTITRLADGEPGSDGAPGADGFTISASKDTHSYVTYPGGDIKGSLDAGLIKLSVINGSTVLSCTSTSTSAPTINGTYRVTNAVTSTGLTIAKSISGSQFVLFPGTFTSDEGTVTLTIVARMNNTNYTFTKVVTYNKVSDGSDADMTEYEYLKDAIGQDAELTGALFTLVTILLKESMAADVTAGISGEQGASLDAPAFWSGGTYAQAIANTAKTILRHDGSGHLASGSIEWDDAGNVEMNGIEAINARFTGSIKTPFITSNPFPNPTQPHGASLYLDNDNDHTVVMLPTPTAANGMIVRIVNNRSSTKMIRTPVGGPVPIYNNNQVSDSNRHDMPAYSYCELVAFGDSSSLRGWVVTTQVNL